MRGWRALRIVGRLLQIAGVLSGGLGSALCLPAMVHEDNPPYDVLEGAGAAAALGIIGVLFGLVSWGLGWGLRAWSKRNV